MPQTIKQSKKRRRRRLLKYLALGGIIGPILFSIVATIGVFLYPDYSLISTSISEMETKGAAHKALVDSIVIPWVSAAIPFAIALHKGIKNRGKLIEKVGPISIILAAIVNLTLALFFPLDPEIVTGNTSTPGTTMHITLVTISVPLTLLGPLALWRRLKHDKEWRGYDKYSLITFAAMLVMGIGNAFVIGGPYAGIVERLTLAIAMQWNLVMAVKLIRTLSNQAEENEEKQIPEVNNSV